MLTGLTVGERAGKQDPEISSKLRVTTKTAVCTKRSSRSVGFAHQLVYIDTRVPCMCNCRVFFSQWVAQIKFNHKCKFCLKLANTITFDSEKMTTCVSKFSRQ